MCVCKLYRKVYGPDTHFTSVKGHKLGARSAMYVSVQSVNVSMKLEQLVPWQRHRG